MEEITDKQYIRELELALIFMCDVYNKAYESVGCRENEDKQTSDKYADLWFHFPMIQGSSNKFAIDKIGSLRTVIGNREENKMSFNDIFERMHIGRKTEREFNDQIRQSAEKRKTKDKI